MTLGIVPPPLFPRLFLDASSQRSARVCTLRLRYNRGNGGQGIIQKLTCTVWACVYFYFNLFLLCASSVCAFLDCIFRDELCFYDWSRTYCGTGRYTKAGNLLSIRLGCPSYPPERKLVPRFMWMHFFFTQHSRFVVITLLLQHEPDKRPTALELSQSPLLPSRLEDEYFKGALRMMGWFSFFFFSFGIVSFTFLVDSQTRLSSSSDSLKFPIQAASSSVQNLSRWYRSRPTGIRFLE